MAVATQTMTDEQRKSVALEYLKALDNAGMTSTGGSILDLFADDAQVMFPKWGPGHRQGADWSAVRRHRGLDVVHPPPLRRTHLRLLRLGRLRRGGHQPRGAQGRALARRRARMGRRPVVRRLRDPRLSDPAVLHLPGPRLRRT